MGDQGLVHARVLVGFEVYKSLLRDAFMECSTYGGINCQQCLEYEMEAVEKPKRRYFSSCSQVPPIGVETRLDTEGGLTYEVLSGTFTTCCLVNTPYTLGSSYLVHIRRLKYLRAIGRK